MAKVFGGFNTANTITFDDGNADLIEGVSEAALQQVIEKVDERQDFTEATLVSLKEKTSYYHNPVRGVLNTTSPPLNLNPGDRYIDTEDPTIIKTVGGQDEEFRNGAMVRELNSDRLWSYSEGKLVQYLPSKTPIYFALNLTSNLRLREIIPLTIEEHKYYPIILDRLVYPPLIGEVDLASGTYSVKDNIGVHVDFALNFKPHKYAPRPKGYLVWLENNYRDNTWSELVTVGDLADSYFKVRSHNLNIRYNNKYLLAIKTDYEFGIEDIILATDTYLNVGVKDDRVEVALQNNRQPLSPLIKNIVYENNGDTNFDVTYTLERLKESANFKSLTVSLKDSQGREIQTADALSNVDGNGNYKITFTNIAGFENMQPKKYYLQMDYA